MTLRTALSAPRAGLWTLRLAPCLLVAGMLLAPRGASAHFVWAETDPAGKNAARVFFGEYPTLREAKDLLDKVAGTKVYAVSPSGRRELKTERGENFFRASGVDGAPVVVADLNYGVLAREGSPAFMLRYQAQLLLGDGKPLSAEKLATLSALKSDLPVVVSLKAAGPDAVELTAWQHGKPTAAEVWRLGPKEAAALEAKGNKEDDEGASGLTEKTSPDGKLRIPLKDAGWYHLRVKVEDPRATTVDSPEGKKEVGSTRTYLSLMFHSAGAGGSAAAPKSGGVRLVNAAAGEQKADADAVQLLHDAHAARASWGKDFPGFTANAVFQYNGKEAKGTITVDREYKITYGLNDAEAEKALRASFGSLIMHRRGGNPEYSANWRDTEVHPMGRAINLNDESESVYRIRDRQIMQVNRIMGTQRFTTNVLENEKTSANTFLPRSWTVSYFNKETGALVRTSTTLVTWAWMGNVFAPATLEVVSAGTGQNEVMGLTLTNHRLLK